MLKLADAKAQGSRLETIGPAKIYIYSINKIYTQTLP